MSKRKKQIAKLDKLWAVLVIARDGGMCQKCGKLGHAAHHIELRRYMTIRHDLRNGLTLCTDCHIYHAHGQPVDFNQWFMEEFPERYEAIQGLKYDVKIDLDEAERRLKGDN